MAISNKARVFARLALAGCLLATTVAAVAACATAGRRQTDFEQAQLKYTQLVRWSAFGEAEEYVAQEEREAFGEVTQALGGVQFIDYRIQSVDFDAETNKAKAVVMYSAYKRAAPAAISVLERQSWTRDEESKAWMVRSTFVEKAYDAQRRD